MDNLGGGQLADASHGGSELTKGYLGENLVFDLTKQNDEWAFFKDVPMWVFRVHVDLENHVLGLQNTISTIWDNLPYDWQQMYGLEYTYNYIDETSFERIQDSTIIDLLTDFDYYNAYSEGDYNNGVRPNTEADRLVVIRPLIPYGETVDGYRFPVIPENYPNILKPTVLRNLFIKDNRSSRIIKSVSHFGKWPKIRENLSSTSLNYSFTNDGLFLNAYGLEYIQEYGDYPFFSDENDDNILIGACSVLSRSCTLERMFYSLPMLKSIPADLFYNIDCKFLIENSDDGDYYSLLRTFANCVSLTSIPENLFDPLQDIKLAFVGTFYNCLHLEHIPPLWEKFKKEQIYSASQCFNGCNEADNLYDAAVAGWA